MKNPLPRQESYKGQVLKRRHCDIFSFLLMFVMSSPSAAVDCKNNVLRCYLNVPEKINQTFFPLSRQYDVNYHVTINSYTLSSQVWPKPDIAKYSLVWQHTLMMYQPDVIKTNQALLFINGGTRYKNAGGHNPPPANMNFAKIASLTHSIVIDLQDIPNQQLMCDDNKSRKEDSLVAYSWSKFLDNPKSNQFWPVHLPMTKTIVKAMDAAQKIALQEANVQLKHFVIAGASKRGWATWLAALSDSRINAMVPIAIDILNTKANIQHIYASYNNHWPAAFHDYVEAKITDRINTPEFDQLMQLEDPLAYLEGKDKNDYRKRFRIPKYIISASGDDFFVPDSMNLYLDKLPGETLVRVVPNQPHYIDMKVVEEAVLSFYQTIINQTHRPSLTWDVDVEGKIIKVRTTQKPILVRLWEAENANARDFRLAAGIHYVEKELHGTCVENRCDYLVDVGRPAKGWKSHFVEVVFQGEELFVVTTSAYVVSA